MNKFRGNTSQQQYRKVHNNRYFGKMYQSTQKLMNAKCQEIYAP